MLGRRLSLLPEVLATLASVGAAAGCGDGSGRAETASIEPSVPTPPASLVPAFDPGSKAMHRLNTVEYNSTVGDVLGTTIQPADAHWRGGELGGFDNIATVLGVDETQYDRYFEAAQMLATEVFASEQRVRFVPCDPSEADCVRASIETAGLRLFRRPLGPDEVATYERVYAAARELGDEPLAALELAFRALLSSAEFLFRVEFDSDPTSAEPHPLSGFELASRLSYFLWSSAPDDELLRLAAEDSLLEAETLAAVVDRMLEDPRSERLVSNFSGQWLGARRVVSHPVAPEYYRWSPEVAVAARDEMVLYFSEFFRNERSWFEFPEADINFIDGWLALLYGMPSPVDSHTRVEFQEDQRAGFFGLAGFLAITSFDRRTSPSLRGRWIASNLLCRQLPDPPPDVPELEGGEQGSTLNVRQVLEAHRENPACASCHDLFDAYGLALEEYDAIGQYRTEYADGTAVDASGLLPASAAYPEGQWIVGRGGLATAVASDPGFGRCLAENLLTYGLGRLVTTADEPALEQALLKWTAPPEVPSVRRLIRLLVASEPFRFRRGGGDGEGGL